ncbi:2,3-bisphosphoglycerate-independent phosphoglycerate mutase [Candidatus Woesearchaeota archaeon]|nr:2,3-bisphosphoglycerate-independent phosphoglycerate mutase [Candidatus Woesearchaeota archaeon]
MVKTKNKVILLIADGWGFSKKRKGNYIKQAKTPVFENLKKKYPHTLNKASGEAVGLPEGSQGNSEVGHLHMGAGRIVWQLYSKINKAIKDKSFFKNKRLEKVIDFVKKKDSKLHLIGLCSDEGVHAHVKHLFALLEMAKKKKIENVYIHFFADGRDVPEKSAKKYIKQIKNKGGKIATVVGRYYSMDRDNNWKRTKKAYDLLVDGKGFDAENAEKAVDNAYKRGEKTDYYIKPTVVDKEGLIEDGDGVIFFNFRTDRPRQLSHALYNKKFNKFKRKKIPKIKFVPFAPYDDRFESISVFEEEDIKKDLGEVLGKKGLKQLRLAETEKYAHVTYFFNGQDEKPNKGEERKMIQSPKVPSYDQKPEMSAYEIAEEAEKQIKKKKFDFILLNFANCDLVGHSAVKKAIIKCVEVVDECQGKVIDSALNNDYVVLLTADHGSAEEKLYLDGKPKPSHSCNPVNFFVISDDEKLKKAKLKRGGQKDVAPTVLDIMGIDKPKEMTGKSLIKGK